MDSLNNLDFKKLASQQKSIQMKMRLLALAHFKEGHSRTQIAKFLKVSRTSVNQWVQTFLEEGLEGLQEKPRTGRPAFLNAEQREQLSQYHQAPTLFTELNPIEQVWSGLRQHYLANPSFADYEDIVSKVCSAWKSFLECSARVRQMCSRRWIDLTVNFPDWYDMSKMHSLERKIHHAENDKTQSEDWVSK
ncbi:helix-turn-helix domain-containing protein [Vibrio vulnificus]|uniref:helix-turn-helix domain-containing protein n=2 Tax=Vibrio vulnificus TaxID=672 RepID=UPI003CC63161